MEKIKANNIETLRDSDKEYLLGILAKDANDLTSYEIGFLKARRSYLTLDNQEFFADALNGVFKGVDHVEEEEETVVRKSKEVKVDENGKKIYEADDYSRDVLVQMCKDAEVEFDPKKATKQEMVDLLNNR